MLVKSLALLLARDNIRVNCIAPGLTNTPMLPQFFGLKSGATDENWEKVSTHALSLIPLGRFARPEDYRLGSPVFGIRGVILYHRNDIISGRGF